MDNSTTSGDDLNDSTPLPELSFDDLLDVSPVKSKDQSASSASALGHGGGRSGGGAAGGDSSDTDDVSALGAERKLPGDDTLHTPGPKRPPQSVTGTTMTTPLGSRVVVGRSMAGAVTPAAATAQTTTTTTTTASTTSAQPILLNTKNILPKWSSIFPNQLIKITPKTGTSTTALTTITAPSVATAGVSLTSASSSTSASSTSAPAAATPSAVMSLAGKTAVKTANGQIVYIKKTGGGQLRIQPSSAVVSASNAPATSTTNATMTTTVAAKPTATSTATGISSSAPPTPTTATATTVVGGNKAVAFQVIRSADGKFVPLKPAAGAAGAAVVAGKKVGGGAVVIKTSLKPLGNAVAAASTAGNTTNAATSLTTVTSNAGATTTAATTVGGTVLKNVKIQKVLTATSTASGGAPKGGSAAGGAAKIVVQSANGKQIVVSNQHLIKLSPKPAASSAAAAAAAIATTTTTAAGVSDSPSTSTASGGGGTSTAAGGGSSLQLLGKTGVHVVRVLPGSKLANVVAAATAGGASVSSSPAAAAGAKTTAAAPTTYKILNPTQPSKMTVVQSHSGNKLVTATPQSPKREHAGSATPSSGPAGSAAFSPVTSKVQKTIVTVPTLRSIGGGVAPSSTLDEKIAATPVAGSGRSNGSNAVGGGATQQQRKYKITEINSEIQRITAVPAPSRGGSEATTDARDDNDDDDGNSSAESDNSAGPPKMKRFATMVSGKRIVVMGRQAAPRPVGGVVGTAAIATASARPAMQRITVQGTVKAATNAGSSSSTTTTTTTINSATSSTTATNSVSNNPTKKFYSVLKAEDKSATPSPSNTAVEARAPLERKSLPAYLSSMYAVKPMTKSLLVKKRIAPDTTPVATVKQEPQRPQASQRPSSTAQSAVSKSNAQSAGSAAGSTATSSSTTTTTSTTPPSAAMAAAMAATIASQSALNVKEEPVDDMKPLIDEGTLVRRKHCNCSKSQCLKLYCDCFANGEFCQDCTCKDCCNNLTYEDARQMAIRSCLERNPSAFKPKITTRDQGDMRLHNKGCNCKRSGCLKNYCECYEAKIPCSSNCKCVGCRNFDFRNDMDGDHPLLDGGKVSTGGTTTSGSRAPGQKRSYDKAGGGKALSGRGSSMNAELFGTASNASSGSGSGFAGTTSSAGYAPPPEKQQCNLITQEVIDATIQCMISQADECEKNGLEPYQTEKMVMEECGRCLVEIIDFSIRNADSSYTQD